jgi:hypothetical protein
MLFAVWTENRATEEIERISVRASSVHSVSLHELSRSNTVSIVPVPPSMAETRPASRGEDASVKDVKTVKFEEVVDPENHGGSPRWDDSRPPVFKSTFWEIACIVSIVCGQLTNVFSSLQKNVS